MGNALPAVPAFASGHGRSTAAVSLLGVCLLLAVLSAAADFAQLRLVQSALSGEAVTQEAAEANDSRQQLIGTAQVAAFVVTGISFLLWVHRAHRNLPALGAQGLRFTPGWAVGYFFLPLINLYRPYQAVAEIWQASDPAATGEAWKDAGPSQLLGGWWAFFLLSGFAGRAMGSMAQNARTAQEVLQATWVSIAANLLTVVAAALAILVVREIDARQEMKIRALTPMGAAPISPV